jgi:hypothetical protein
MSPIHVWLSAVGVACLGVAATGCELTVTDGGGLTATVTRTVTIPPP